MSHELAFLTGCPYGPPEWASSPQRRFTHANGLGCCGDGVALFCHQVDRSYPEIVCVSASLAVLRVFPRHASILRNIIIMPAAQSGSSGLPQLSNLRGLWCLGDRDSQQT